MAAVLVLDGAVVARRTWQLRTLLVDCDGGGPWFANARVTAVLVRVRTVVAWLVAVTRVSRIGGVVAAVSGCSVVDVGGALAVACVAASRLVLTTTVFAMRDSGWTRGLNAWL